MCLREKSFAAASGAFGIAGPGSRIGSSAALATVKNGRSSEAVTRLAEGQKLRRRMMKRGQKGEYGVRSWWRRDVEERGQCCR
jgi:hypothetical protein